RRTKTSLLVCPTPTRTRTLPQLDGALSLVFFYTVAGPHRRSVDGVMPGIILSDIFSMLQSC
ncbi:MAG: hypothetical protein VXW43_15005, partial [Pseudomonadota bacterium]|nr:hypothetical protein [Pseudomonadota bacterium]